MWTTANKQETQAGRSMRVIADTDDLQQRNPGEKAAFITCSWNTKLATLGHLNIPKVVRFKPIQCRAMVLSRIVATGLMNQEIGLQKKLRT